MKRGVVTPSLPGAGGSKPHRKTTNATGSAPSHEEGKHKLHSPAEDLPPAFPPLTDALPGVSPALPVTCPISGAIYQVIHLSSDLARAMRQLRRKLNACQDCSLEEACAFRAYFQAQVNAAILEVNAEWEVNHA
jgi:hypothetical protein